MIREIVYTAWKELVKEQVGATLPELAEVSMRRGEWKRALKYELPNDTGNIFCYVIFRFLDSDEAFDLWGLWSKKKNVKFLPWFTMEPIDDFSRDEAFHDSLSIAGRSGASAWSFWEPSDPAVDDSELFAEEYVQHYFKDLSEEEVRELVLPSVLEAVKEVEEHVIPYLKKRIDAEFTA